MRAAELATTTGAADTALGDGRTVAGDEINGTKLQNIESAFFGVLETFMISRNQPTDGK